MSREKVNRTQSRDRNIFSQISVEEATSHGGRGWWTFGFFLEELAKGHRDRFLFLLKRSNRQGPRLLFLSLSLSLSLSTTTLSSLRFRLDNGCLLIVARQSCPQGPLKRMSSEFLKTAKEIGNGSLGKKGCEFSVIAVVPDGDVSCNYQSTNCNWLR